MAENETPQTKHPLDAAMGFCYALLVPGADANELIRRNPDSAKAAHRALYERIPRGKSYDEMMASIPR